MSDQFSRTELLLGKKAMDKLAASRVAVFGIGGVGGYVCEALARSGVGAFDLIDNDKVSLTNLNRQIIATYKTIGKYKTEVMKERILDINPEAGVITYNCFFLPENADEFPFDEYDYIVDAVDTVTAKIELVMKAQEKNIPIISSMGAGNKLDGSQFKVADIYKTSMCPLAKVMRRELKKRGVKKLKVVYSEEKPTRPLEDMSISSSENDICPSEAEHECSKRKDIPGSVAFVPSVAGFIMAGEVVKDLCKLPFKDSPKRNYESL
ncbi:MAG: tRNA threonylcarbamoyladenosine dehydratase [Lachnoclostridium sp.]|nr:tRNA threonylcarbamoyladenosine dehydratase [Lachnoclostridium sp.]